MFINNQPIFIANPHKDDSLRDWREYAHSLTDKLQKVKGSTQLTLMSQKWTQPCWWDKYLLQIRDAQIFEREILMKHQDTAFWYARTIIPQKCYNVDPDFFKRLEKESIRNLIFDNPNVHRVTLLNYPIDKQCIEYHWAKRYLEQLDGVIWVRLAEYSFNELESFYLAELLLPELESAL